MTVGKACQDYDESETLQFGLAHIIQVIGEAADHVSDQFKEAQPQIPWHEIIGMRHRIVHDYMNVDEDVIWSVVRNDLPLLMALLEKTIPPDIR